MGCAIMDSCKGEGALEYSLEDSLHDSKQRPLGIPIAAMRLLFLLGIRLIDTFVFWLSVMGRWV